MNEYVIREEFNAEVNRIYELISNLTNAITDGINPIGERLSKNEAAITNAYEGMSSMLEMIRTLATKMQ